MSDLDQLKTQIQGKLIESGEYDRISALLKERLAETGWFDNIKKLANDEINNQDEPSFDKLNSVLEPRALSMVPEQVREEILLQIKQFLEKNVET